MYVFTSFPFQIVFLFSFRISLFSFLFWIGLFSFPFPICLSPLPFSDEETDMDVHDRGMLYYRLLKHDVAEVSSMSWLDHGDESPLILLCCGLPLTLLYVL